MERGTKEKGADRFGGGSGNLRGACDDETGLSLQGQKGTYLGTPGQGLKSLVSCLLFLR